MIKQRTKEWYNPRIGKFTASNSGKIMSRSRDESSFWSKTAFNYIEKLAMQVYFNEYLASPDNDATRWGMKYEINAIQEFSRITGYKFNETGFTLHPEINDVGATPDFQVIESDNTSEYIIAQIKCPYNTNNHLKYIDKIHDNNSLKKTKSFYYWQLQAEMWITGAKYNYFISYDPRSTGRKRLHYVKISKDEETINQLKEKTIKAVSLRNEIIESVISGYKPPKKLIYFLKI